MYTREPRMDSYHAMISLCSLLHVVPCFLLFFSPVSSGYNNCFFRNKSKHNYLFHFISHQQPPLSTALFPERLTTSSVWFLFSLASVTSRHTLTLNTSSEILYRHGYHRESYLIPIHVITIVKTSLMSLPWPSKEPCPNISTRGECTLS